MARPLEFDPDKALNEAMELFWSNGYDATSLSDLLEAMELSKSSFYQSFGNKKQLYQQCLHQYRKQISKQLLAELDEATSAMDFLKDLFVSISRKANTAEGRRGCLIMNSASAKAPLDSEIGKIVAEGAQQFENIFYQAIKRAQKEGDIPSKKDPQILAKYLVSSRSGLLAMAKSGSTPDELNQIIDVTLMGLE